MNASSTKLRLLVIACFAIAGGAFAAESGASSTTKSVPVKPATKEAVKKEAEAKSAQQSMMEQFKAQADSFSKDHDALLKQLNSAPEEKRKDILEKMEERKKEFEAKLNALHKQMRDEQRKQRQSGGPKSR